MRQKLSTYDWTRPWLLLVAFILLGICSAKAATTPLQLGTPFTASEESGWFYSYTPDSDGYVLVEFSSPMNMTGNNAVFYTLGHYSFGDDADAPVSAAACNGTEGETATIPGYGSYQQYSDVTKVAFPVTNGKDYCVWNCSNSVWPSMTVTFSVTLPDVNAGGGEEPGDNTLPLNEGFTPTPKTDYTFTPAEDGVLTLSKTGGDDLYPSFLSSPLLTANGKAVNPIYDNGDTANWIGSTEIKWELKSGTTYVFYLDVNKDPQEIGTYTFTFSTGSTEPEPEPQTSATLNINGVENLLSITDMVTEDEIDIAATINVNIEGAAPLMFVAKDGYQVTISCDKEGGEGIYTITPVMAMEEATGIQVMLVLYSGAIGYEFNVVVSEIPADGVLPINQTFEAEAGSEYLYNPEVSGRLSIYYEKDVDSDDAYLYILENGKWNLIDFFLNAPWVGPDFTGEFEYGIEAGKEYKFAPAVGGTFRTVFVQSAATGETADFMLLIGDEALSDDAEFFSPVEPGFNEFTIFANGTIELGERDEYGNEPLALITIKDMDGMSWGGVDSYSNGVLKLYSPFEFIGDFVIDVPEGVFVISGNPSTASQFYFTTGNGQAMETELYVRGAFNEYAQAGEPEWQLAETGEGTKVYEGKFEIPAGEFEFNLQSNEGVTFVFEGEGTAPSGTGDGEEERPGVMIMPVSFTNGVWNGEIKMALGGEENFFWANEAWNGGSITITADLNANTIKIEANEGSVPPTIVYLTNAEIDPADGSVLEGLGKVEIAWDGVTLDLDGTEKGVAYPLNLDLVTIYVNGEVNDAWKTLGMTHGSLTAQNVVGTNEQGGSTGVDDTTGEGQTFDKATLVLSTGDMGYFLLQGNLRVVIEEGAVKSTTGAISPKFDLTYIVAQGVPVTTFEPAEGASLDADNAVITVSYGDGYETFTATGINDSVTAFVDQYQSGDKIGTIKLSEKELSIKDGKLVIDLSGFEGGSYSLNLPAGLVNITDGFNAYISTERFYEFSIIAGEASEVQFTFVPGEGFDMNTLVVWDSNASAYIQDQIADNKLDFTYHLYPSTLKFIVPVDEVTNEVGYEIELTTDTALEEDAYEYLWTIDESTGNGVGTLVLNEAANGAQFKVAINPVGAVQPAPGLNVTLNLGNLSASALSSIIITNAIDEEIEIAGDEVVLPVYEQEEVYHILIPYNEDGEPFVQAPEGVTYPEDSWWQMLQYIDITGADEEVTHFQIDLTLTDLLPEDAVLDLVVFGLAYDEGLNMNLVLDAPADFDLENIHAYDFAKDEALEWTVNDGETVMTLNVENTEMKIMLRVDEGYELSVVAPEGLSEGSYKIGTQLYNPDENAEDEDGNVTGGGESLEYTYIWINTEANNATFQVVVKAVAGEIELPDPDVSANVTFYAGGGYFDAFDLVWWKTTNVPYQLEIVDPSQITVTKNMVEDVEILGIDLTEYQEGENTFNYDDSQLVITLADFQFDIDATYTLNIPAGAINVIVDGGKYPNAPISFSVVPSQLGEVPSVELPDPTITPEQGEVDELETITLSWKGFDVYRNTKPGSTTGEPAQQVTMTINGGEPVNVPVTLTGEGVYYSTTVELDINAEIGGEYVITIPEGTFSIMNEDVGTFDNEEIVLKYTVNKMAPALNALVFDNWTMELEKNETATAEVPVSLDVEEAFEYKGFQFDITLPEGLEVTGAALAESGEVQFYTQEYDGNPNTTRFVATIDAATELTEDIITLTVSSTEDINPGVYNVTIQNTVFFSTPGGSDITSISGSTGTVTIELAAVPAEEIIIDSVTLNEPSFTEEENDMVSEVVAGESVDMTITVKPADTTDEVEVTADNGATVTENEDGTWTVDTSGVVVPEGEESVTVTITITAGDVEETYELTVKGVLLGDSNDNGVVTVADVVTTANYIAEKPIDAFCFPNANVILTEVDGEQVINAQDLSATVNIVLKNWDGQREINARRHANRSFSNDRLVADSFHAGHSVIGISLENTMNYSVLQATVELPAGMKVENVTAGPRAAAHELVYNVKGSELNVVLFSYENASFRGGEGSLFNIAVTADENCGDLQMRNIMAADASANGYELSFEGGLNGGTTGIEGIGSDSEGVRYFTVDGIEVLNPEAGQLLIRVANGTAEKVLVK